MQAEQSMLDGIQRSNRNGMDTSLEWKIVVGQRGFTSGHRTVVGEDHNNHGRTK